MPCKMRATARTGKVVPTNNKTVAERRATNPARKGTWRDERRSARIPAKGLVMTEAAA
jgi:hypothetical protein